jgi:5-oxoprolinase (ATP-hydrolysing) subunit C
LALKLLTTGLLTTIQDLGRHDYRDQGVPLSGAMDQHLASVANALVGNPPNAALLEFTLSGPTLEILENTTIAIGAHGFQITVSGRTAPAMQPLRLQKGDHLHIGQTKTSMRGYLAAEGGILCPEILRSRSYYAPLTPELLLSKGTILHCGPSKSAPRLATLGRSLDPDYAHNETLHAWPGPEWRRLSESEQNILLQTRMTVRPDSNRMAVLLDHTENLTAREILTGPVQPGTVQLTPSGRLIVLMRDAQTTGGYSRILQLTERAVNTLAQKRPGSTLTFSFI